MKSTQKLLGAIAAAVLICTAGAAWAEEPQVVAARDAQTAAAVAPDRAAVAPSSAALFSSSGLGRTGEFTGKIVNLSCDSVRMTLATAECDQGEHFFALELDGSNTLYPLLLLGNQPSVERLRAGEFTGKEVRVAGVHYSSSGAILVSDIFPRS
ncbi:MAG TPA: hypothetical protein VIS07_08145 [Candidatus Binatia bacterium]